MKGCMPKSKTKSKTPATSPADALIASARKSGYAPMPSDDAVSALLQVLKHNDSQPRNNGRVSRLAASEMLRDSYGWNHGQSALESLCRRLGRTSWGKP